METDDVDYKYKLDKTKSETAEVKLYKPDESFPKESSRGKKLGGGGFGKVYMLVDRKRPDDELFVVKVIKFYQGRDYKKNLDSFKRETKILCLLNDHHRIVPFYGHADAEAEAFIFMGYMAQGSLSNFVRSKPLSEDVCFNFIHQILEGLEYLHDQRVIHRDVKGDNILLETKNKIRLTDFGISKVVTNLNENNTPDKGTVRWMAPEVISAELNNNESYTFKADCWSLGCTVIEMLTGEVPYSSHNFLSAIFRVSKGESPELPNSISNQMEEFFNKTLVNCQERMSAKELLEHFFSKGTSNDIPERSDYSECFTALQDVPCSKNQGHSAFMSIRTLTLSDLSNHNMSDDAYELTKSVAELTVQINVYFTSSKRPKHWPDSVYLYPNYNMRDKTETRLGSGCVYSVTVHGSEHGKCPCQKCFMSIEPSKSWGVIEVMTATHVVFDVEEAEHTTCRFFYEEADSEEVTMNGFKIVTADVSKNWCLLKCVTCNSEILNRVSKEMGNFQSLQNFDDNLHAENNKMGFIVSHPHGGPKQISFGELRKKNILDQTWSQLTYTMSTCPGSSGAYVYVAGESGQVWHYPHVHSGAFTSGLNYSSVGYCGAEEVNSAAYHIEQREDDYEFNNRQSDIDMTSIFNEWEKGELICRGEFSKVYSLIELHQLSKQFIIVKEKLLPEENSKRQRILKAYQIEHEVLQTSGEHRRIIAYHGYKVQTNCITKLVNFMTMGSISDYYRNNGPIDEEMCLIFVSQILEGLQFLHQNDIIHMDIRAKNIFLKSEKNVKISNFEHARKGSQNIQSVEPWSVRWTAPEIINPDFGCGICGVQADIWSLGCTVVEMLTADVPYEYFKSITSVVVEIGNGKPPRIRGHISDDMTEILQDVFEPEANLRISASSFLNKACIQRNILNNNCREEILQTLDRNKEKKYNTSKKNIKKHDEANTINQNIWNVLITATKNKHFEVIQHLLTFGANVNARNINGWTALMFLSDIGLEEQVNLLIESGAKINEKNNKRRTSLILSATNGHTKTVELLLRNGANIYETEKDGWTALMISSHNGHTETVKLLLKSGANVHQKKKNGWTALMLSSQNGHTETVELLLKYGSSINELENKCWTALMISSQNGHTETVELLLKSGANVDQKNKNGWTALMISSHNGHTKTVELLLKYGANINETKDEGWTALMMSSQNGHSKTVELLLKFGANINVKNEIGRTALMISSQNGHTEIVELLLKYGANINETETHGWTTLMMSSQTGHSRTVELLLKYGAYVNKAEMEGWTALMFSSQNGHTETVESLLRSGANINDTERQGWTALMLSSQNGHTETVKLLLKSGANVHQKNKNCWTALMLSSQNGHTDTVKLLLKYGANVNDANVLGSPAYTIAIKNGHIALAVLLKNLSNKKKFQGQET